MNILVIGLGSIAKKHINAIKDINLNVVIYALRSSKTSFPYPGIIDIYSLDNLRAKPDFVLISNPTYLHKYAMEIAMDLNCPLFIEKPVFGNLDGILHIIRGVEEKQIMTYVACNLRFHPSILFLKQYLADENHAINEVNIYCGSYLPDWRPETDFRKSYSSKSEMGGGVHLDLIHEIDYCYWLFGEPSRIHVIRRNISSLGIDAIDYANYTMIYPNFTVNIILNYYRRDPKRQIEIITQGETILVDLLNNSIVNTNSGVKMHEGSFSISMTYEAQMRYFINSLKSKQQPMNDLSEGITVLKMALHE